MIIAERQCGSCSRQTTTQGIFPVQRNALEPGSNLAGQNTDISIPLVWFVLGPAAGVTERVLGVRDMRLFTDTIEEIHKTPSGEQILQLQQLVDTL